MQVLRWYMLQTLVLLLAQLVTSHICKSLISMLDGFHTLYIFLQMAVSLRTQHRTRSSGGGATEAAPTPPPSSAPSIKPPQTPGSAHSSNTGSSAVDSNRCYAAVAVGSCSAPTLTHCGLSYPKMRSKSVEVFCSALCLATLCGTYCLEVLPQVAEPTEKRFPLVSAAVGAFSVLHNALVLGLTWGQLLEGGPRAEATAKTKGNSGDPGEPGRVAAKAGRATAAAAAWSEPLVLSNPGALGALDPESRGPQQGAGGNPSAPVDRAPLGEIVIERPSSTGLNHNHHHPVHPTSVVGIIKVNLENQCLTEVSHDCHVFGDVIFAVYDDHIPSHTSDDHADHVTAKCRWRCCPPLAKAAFQALFSAVLAVVNGLVLLLAVPQDCVPVSSSCTSLVHLDFTFAMLATIVLLIKAVPQVYRYGLLLLQAPPTNVSVSELKVKISSVPGVQSLHDFHIWQLSDTCTVASVHIHCQDGFQKHRCGDLISAVTKVIHSVGISCCTIQPEFPLVPPPAGTSSPGRAAAGGCCGSPNAAPARACGLACGKACEEKMCCSPPTEETPIASPTGAVEKDHQALVIENPANGCPATLHTAILPMLLLASETRSCTREHLALLEPRRMNLRVQPGTVRGTTVRGTTIRHITYK
ncbi:putative zinc transporter protein [Merluccius polli]|uniref:Zinc transporter protein n=1 Tax=Merluccius polli TaxID=89951 RepID=A0AA47MXH0_MERPO|nr:putative zinc transporter protein [Merluccius polli]